MKILNFSVVEILPALLDKSKTQTIRPAFKYKVPSLGIKRKIRFEKPARFKIGEKVKLMWNQRSKYKMFCKHCGKGIPILEGNVLDNCFCDYPHKDYPLDTFHKFLGTAKITEFFKIEMYFINELMFGIRINGKELTIMEISELSKLDGFNDLEEMFKWFDEKYDISKPKQFWVYRWKWLK